MPQHSTQQGDYLLSLWAARFGAAFGDVTMELIRAGFQQSVVHPELEKEFPIPQGSVREALFRQWRTAPSGLDGDGFIRGRLKDPPVDPPSAGSVSVSLGAGSSNSGGSVSASDSDSLSGGSVSVSGGSHSDSKSGGGPTSTQSGFQNDSDCTNQAAFSCASAYSKATGISGCGLLGNHLCPPTLGAAVLCGCFIEYCDGSSNLIGDGAAGAHPCQDPACCNTGDCPEIFVVCCYDNGGTEVYFVDCCACA